MDYLCECSTDKDRLEALQKLPRDLPSSYERILDRANRSTEQNRVLVRNALHWIAYAQAPLKTTQLLQALAIHDQDGDFNSSAMTTEVELRHWCSSLVRQNLAKDGLEFAHFTVKGFLMAIEPTSLPGYVWYRLNHDQLILSRACIKLLGCRTFDGKVPPIHSNSFWVKSDIWNKFAADYSVIKYAGRYLLDHVHETDWTFIEEDMWKIFEPRQNSTFEFWSTLVMCCLEMRLDYIDVLLLPGPLHFAAMFALDKICTKLLLEGLDVNKTSYLGTPLNCALRHDLSGVSMDRIHDDPGKLYYVRPIDRQGEVLSTLVNAGADTYNGIDPAGSSAVKVSMLLDYYYYSAEDNRVSGFSCLKTLLKCGTKISSTDMNNLFNRLPMNSDYYQADLEGTPYPNIINLVLESNGAVLMQEAHPCFLKNMLIMLVKGQPFSSAWWFRMPKQVESGIFTKDELLAFNINPNAKNISKKENTCRALISAMVRTWKGLDNSIVLYSNILRECARCSQPTMILTLLEKLPGLDLFHLDEDGNSYLHLIGDKASTGISNLMLTTRLLLSSGVCPMGGNSSRLSPVKIAARQSDLASFQLLWEAVKARSRSQMTVSLATLAQRCFILAARYYDGTRRQIMDYLGLELERLNSLSVLSMIGQLTTTNTDHNSWKYRKSFAGINKWFKDLSGISSEALVRKLETSLEDHHQCNTVNSNGNLLSFDLIAQRALPIILGPQVPPTKFKIAVQGNVYPIHGILSITTLLHGLLHNPTALSKEKIQVLLESHPDLFEMAGHSLQQAENEEQCTMHVRSLLELGMSINLIFQPFGDNCLHIAARRRFMHLAGLLADYGCDAGQRNGNGLTPLDLARNYGFQELEGMLTSAAVSKQHPSVVETSKPSASVPASEDISVELPLRTNDPDCDEEFGMETRVDVSARAAGELGTSNSNRSSTSYIWSNRMDFDSSRGTLSNTGTLLVSESSTRFHASPLKRSWTVVDNEENGLGEGDRRLRARHDT